MTVRAGLVVVPWELYDPTPQVEQLSMLAWSEGVVVSAMVFPLAHRAQVLPLYPAMLVDLLTVCVALTVYVPTPPIPLPKAVIVVPVVIPVPTIV